MNTSDQQPIALSKEEFKRIREEFKQAKRECADNALINMQNDIKNIDEILPIIQQADVSFDELVIPLHNLISIVPEEQHRFLQDLKTLFIRMPRSVQEERDFMYVRNRLMKLEKADTDCKIQTIDLSQYWSAYRCFLYRYGIIENSKQIKAQDNILKTMLKVCICTVAKRTRGIESAKKFIKHDGDKLERPRDDNRDK